MIVAVEHALGLSLFEARTIESALKKAHRYFGDYGGPYHAPEDQKDQIAMAKSMGAAIIG